MCRCNRDGCRVGKGAKRRAHAVSLSELSGEVSHISAPVCGQDPSRNELLKRAVRLIHDLAHVAVLDWIVVNVVHVPLQVAIIADGMLPITALPYPQLSSRNLACRPWHLTRKAT